MARFSLTHVPEAISVVLVGAAGGRVRGRRRRAGRHGSHAGAALDRGVRRGAPAPRPRSEGPPSVVC